MGYNLNLATGHKQVWNEIQISKGKKKNNNESLT